MNATRKPTAKALDRTNEQRRRILNAAQTCFVEHGFHAASMALLANKAEMSPGLIYRYFPGKDAIILAIVEQQLDEARADIRALHDAPDLAGALFEIFNRWRKADPTAMNAALFLEMSAQASRDPALAAALRTADLVVREQLCRWLCASVDQGGKAIPAELAPLRAVSLQVFVAGLAIRAVREPDLAPETLRAMIAQFVEGLFAR